MGAYTKIVSNGCHYATNMVNKAGGAIKSGITKPQSLMYTKRNRPPMIGRKY